MNLINLAYNTIRRRPRLYISLSLNIIFSFAIILSGLCLYNNPSIQVLRSFLQGGLIDDYVDRVPLFIISVVGLLTLLGIIYAVVSLYKERRRDLGIFLIHGFSRGQFRKLLSLEITFVCLVSTFLGIIPGLLLDFLLRHWVQNLIEGLTLSFHFPGMSILITICIFSFISILASYIVPTIVQRDKIVNLLYGQEKINIEPKVHAKRAIISFLLFSFLIYIAYFSNLKSLIQLGPIFLVLVFICIIFAGLGTYLLLCQGSIYIISRLRKKLTFSWKGSRILCLGGLAGRLKQNSFFIVMLSLIFSFLLTIVGIKEIIKPLDSSGQLMEKAEKGPWLINELGLAGVKLSSDPRVQHMKSAINPNLEKSSYGVDIFSYLKQQPFLSSHLQVFPFVDMSIKVKEIPDVLVRSMSMEDYNKVATKKVFVPENQVLFSCFQDEEFCRDTLDAISQKFPDKKIILDRNISNMEVLSNFPSNQVFLLWNGNDFIKYLNDLPREEIFKSANFDHRVYLESNRGKALLNMIALYPSNNNFPDKEMLKNILKIEPGQDAILNQNKEKYTKKIQKKAFNERGINYSRLGFNTFKSYYHILSVKLSLILSIAMAACSGILMSLIFISSRLYSDIDSQSKQFYSLFRIGVPFAKIKSAVSFQVGILFFLPSFIAILLASFPIAALFRLMSTMGGYLLKLDSNLINYFVIAAGSFLLIILVFYLISRDWIFRLLKREFKDKF